MTRELRPGVFIAIFDRLAVQAEALGPGALTALALDMERETKKSLARTSHRYGERTSARRGGPPALVSGTLRRAISHTRAERTATGWEMRVGVARGFYPPYPKRGKRTAASEYGYFLERELDFPFLEPAFRAVVARTSAASLGRLLRADWRIR